MKILNLKRLKIFSHFGRLNLNIKNFNAMLSVKARPRLIGLLLRVSSFCLVCLRKGKISGCVLLVRRISNLYKTRGAKGVTLYLKGTTVLFQQYLGEYRIKDTAAVAKSRVSRNNAGLPRIIPLELRRAIRADEFPLIKWVFTMLNIYRNIEFPGTPNLKSITAPFSGFFQGPGESGFVMHVSVDFACRQLVDYIGPFIRAIGSPLFSREKLEKSGRLFIIWKAAPAMAKVEGEGGVSNFSSHPIQLLLSARNLYKDPKLWASALHCADAFGAFRVAKLLRLAESLRLLGGISKGSVGKLHAKEEAAGKVRIFAIVDAWTQWICDPLQAAIFEVLKHGLAPMDGTFDQLSPLKRLDPSKGLYSVDLSSATDRLPLLIQEWLVAALTGDSTTAQHWANLLVGRTYAFFQLGYGAFAGVYTYCVGQPMGARSSWAMLALVHHFLVQVSAWRSGIVPVGTLYRNYALLGDDLVIGDRQVADQYLVLMKNLGVEINLSKSIISDSGTALEFAKRTVYKGHDVSPVTIRDVFSAMQLLPAFVEFMRSHGLTLSQTLKGFGFGWRVLSWLNKPLGKLPAQVRAIVLAVSMPGPDEGFEGFFRLGTPKVVKHSPDWRGINQKFILAELSGFQLKLEAMLKRVKLFRFGGGSYDPTPGMAEVMPPAWSRDVTLVETHLLKDRIFNLELDAESLEKDHVARRLRATENQLAKLGTNPTEKSRLEEWFYEVWRNLYNIELSNYEHTLGGILRSIPNWVSPFKALPIGKTQTMEDFLSLISQYFLALRERARLSVHIFSFSKPEGLEGMAFKTVNRVTPQAIRFWRAWSGVIQGAINVNQLQLGWRSSKPKVKAIFEPEKGKDDNGTPGNRE